MELAEVGLVLIISLVCLSTTALGAIIKNGLLLLCAGTGWVMFAFLTHGRVEGTLNLAFNFLGAALAIICFTGALMLWLRTRSTRISNSERDYLEYKRKILDRRYY